MSVTNPPAPDESGPESSPPPSRRGPKLSYAVLFTAAILVTGYTGYTEFQASRLQARYFSGLARDMKFGVEAGPTTSVRFPQPGPYDQRLGYSEMPEFMKRLQAKGYEVDAQARVTPQLASLIQSGYAPPYSEKMQAGL